MTDECLNEVFDRIKLVGYINESPIDPEQSKEWVEAPLYVLKESKCFNDQYLELMGYIKRDITQVLIKVDVYESWERLKCITSCNYVFGKDSECMKSYLNTMEDLHNRDKLIKMYSIRLNTLKSLGLPSNLRLQTVTPNSSRICIQITTEEYGLDYVSVEAPIDEDPIITHEHIVKYCNDYIQFLNGHKGFHVEDYDDYELFDDTEE